MKTKIRTACQFIGFMMVMMMAGMGNSSVGFLLAWLIIANIFMFIGKGFSFQQKPKKQSI